jgi:CxxC-x17-CxxC domain-containing protein
MGNFEGRSFENRNERGSSGRGRDSGRSGGRSSRDSGRSGGRDRERSRGSGEMFSAVCDECGANCELPFKPTSGKPVLCSDCFRKAGPSRGSSSRGPSSDNGAELKEINDKLDKILELLTE